MSSMESLISESFGEESELVGALLEIMFGVEGWLLEDSDSLSEGAEIEMKGLVTPCS